MFIIQFYSRPIVLALRSKATQIVTNCIRVIERHVEGNVCSSVYGSRGATHTTQMRNQKTICRNELSDNDETSAITRTIEATTTA